jgi:hypothetical protein
MNGCLRTTTWIWLAILIPLFQVTWAIPSAPPFGAYDDAAFSPTITVLESNANLIRLDLNMSNLPSGVTIDLHNPPQGLWGELNENGSLLPRLSVMLALPATGNPTVSIETWDSTAYPAVPAYLPDNSPRAKRVELFRVGILGGARIVPLTIRPIGYTNNASTCYVLTHAVIRIEIDGTTGDNPITTPWLAFSRPWQQIYRAVLTNWQSIPNYSTGAASHILMIVPDIGIDSVNIRLVREFARWKEQRGTKVTVVPLSSIGTTPSAAMIRDRIISETQASSPRIDYVILIGDENKLPVDIQFTADPFSRFTDFSYPGPFSNEQYFGTFEGNDVFPDLFVGRWVIQSSSELRNIIARSIAHEKAPMHTDSSRFVRAAIAADNELPSQRNTISHVAQMMNAHGITQIDSLWGRGQQTNFYWWADSINRGVNFVNYRGQGWNYGWWGIGFFLNSIEYIQNVGKLPIVTGIGCGVGMFRTEDLGFAEAWMKAGSPAEPLGSAAFIGPCWNTHTVFNDCLDSCLYKAWLDYDVLEVGPGLLAGKMMVWDLFAEFLPDSEVREITQTLVRQYLVQGDPSLQVYTRTPYTLNVAAPDRLPENPASLTFSIQNMLGVPAESLNVTLWYADGDYTTEWMTPGQSDATLPLTSTGHTQVTLTITGTNVEAYQKIIPFGADAVEPVSDPAVPGKLELSQNYPNPFNPETTIGFALPRSGWVSLTVYNLLGEKIAELVNTTLSAGTYRVSWKGEMIGGGTAGSGIYYYRVNYGDESITRKMMLLK